VNDSCKDEDDQAEDQAPGTGSIYSGGAEGEQGTETEGPADATAATQTEGPERWRSSDGGRPRRHFFTRRRVQTLTLRVGSNEVGRPLPITS
jgi:hypothetical protein